MVEWKAFLGKSKHQYHASQWAEHDCSAQSQKDKRLLRQSSFISVDGETLILRKMVEQNAFPTKPQYQYHVSK